MLPNAVLNILGDLPAAFAGEKETGTNQPHGRRKGSEKPQGRISYGRGNCSHLQGVFLCLPLNRVHKAFPLAANIVADLLLDMCGRDDGL
jgi:hypothetical protein